jgi:hypothetical protein
MPKKKKKKKKSVKKIKKKIENNELIFKQRKIGFQKQLLIIKNIKKNINNP